MNKAMRTATAKARAEYNQGRTSAALDEIIKGLEEVAKMEPKAPAAAAKKAKGKGTQEPPAEPPKTA